MKHIVIGDIHGRDCWKDIVSEHGLDGFHYVFLGDYVDTHENISVKSQSDNFKDLCKFKMDNIDKVTLLIGNHDLQYYDSSLFMCSGFKGKTFNLVNSTYKDMIRSKLMVPFYTDGRGNLFSHAGISKLWLDKWYVSRGISLADLLESGECNIMSLGFHTNALFEDVYGDNEDQSCVWIRPKSLSASAIDGYNQYVGHTPMDEVGYISSPDGHDIYLCDTLPNYYVVIDENNKPTKIKI